jgi:hypothetical protein
LVVAGPVLNQTIGQFLGRGHTDLEFRENVRIGVYGTVTSSSNAVARASLCELASLPVSGLASRPNSETITTLHTFVSPEDVKSARRVLVWARNHLIQEHKSLNRPYHPKTVCPFVEGSIKADCFYMVFHGEFDGRDPVAIRDQILRYVKPFNEAPPVAPNEQTLKALLVVFPNIESRSVMVLDECHRMLKPKMVELGLMIGQFHPKCREMAIHNRDWNAVSRCPVPLIAMRHMVIHDVMFLGDDRETFEAYDRRFGFNFADDGKSLRGYHKHLIAYYERARSQHYAVQRAGTRKDEVSMIPVPSTGYL